MESAYFDPYDFISDDSSNESVSEVQDEDYDMASSAGSDMTQSQGSGSSASSGDDMSISDVASSFQEKKNRVFSPIPRASTMSSYSYHSSEQFRTPSPSNQSLTASMRETLYREEYGRELNTFSDVYRLPADEEEIDRLEKQHNMLVDIFGAKYPPPMGVALRQGHYEPTKKVLDLGCGSGAWVKDVCRDFPYCEAIGVDLVPIDDSDPDFPPNLRMEIDDLNKGIEHFYDSFDVVHSRLIAFGIRDYRRLIEHMTRAVRPNGVIEVQEYDFRTYTRDNKLIPANTTDPLGTYPWWATFLAHVREGVAKSGGDIRAATDLESWVRSHEALMDVVYRDVYLPVVPGNCRRYQEDVYTRMKDDVMAFLRSLKPLLMGSGVSEQRYEYLVHHCVRELHESETPQYVRMQCVYATRRPDVLLEPLPPVE
ncbi:S-adenosyl-L-methionine-dependent methyltransferase [Ephemerocybe angulata]|uniref:S-adenosyl-L-methionine-dependent methyltransferase n=1 Tax=Ephemerocybe angulata TaxID=980116 RepID=A0A8H6HYT9_9AGAR|nr:S-adenosyl-L-methionine-dependent methyltransferase [Tulosesus angulatus]